MPLTQSYVHGTSDVPLIGETIGAHFDAAAARWADRDALVVRHQDIKWTWAELKARVDDFAAGLIALGLEPGSRIGIWSPNNAEWVITQFATAKAGLVLVNINPAYRLAELEYALNKVECAALITAARFKTSDYVGMIRELAPEIDAAEPGALSAAKLPHLKTVIQIGEDDIAGMHRFDDVLAMGAAVGLIRTPDYLDWGSSWLQACVVVIIDNEAVDLQQSVRPVRAVVFTTKQVIVQKSFSHCFSSSSLLFS